MHGVRRLLASAVMVALLTSVTSPAALAYQMTGSASSGWQAGYFTWCSPGACTYWYNSSEGTTEWTTTQQHSEGQTWYSVAPFEQDEFLASGTYLFTQGIYPQANWYSVIRWPSGSVYLSGYHTSGPGCWSVLTPPDMLSWPTCNTGGFSMATSTYPPGTTESHYIITASGVSGLFGGVYSGSLR